MLLPVLPQFVEHELGGDTLGVGIAVGAFAVGAVLLRPYAGRLGDRYGRRMLVIVGAFVVATSAALYPLASNLVILVAVRVLGGLGEAAFFVGAGTMIADLAPVERRGEAISYWSVAVYSGLAFGPFLGEVVLDASSYDSVWIVSALLAFGAGLLALLITETLTDEARAAYLALEERQPLLNRSALAPSVILFLGLCGLAGFTELVPLYVTDIGLSDSRLVFLLYGCLILVVRIVGAKVPDRLGPRRAGTLAFIGGASGLAVMAAWASVAGLILGTILFAAGMSLMYPAMLTLALTGIDDSQRGVGGRDGEHVLRPVPGARRAHPGRRRGRHERPGRLPGRVVAGGRGPRPALGRDRPAGPPATGGRARLRRDAGARTGDVSRSPEPRSWAT